MQKKSVFSKFLKKTIQRKRNRIQNSYVQDYVLHTNNCMQKFFGKMLLKYKLRVDFGGAISKFLSFLLNQKLFVVAIKSCLSYDFHIWELYDKLFSKK